MRSGRCLASGTSNEMPASRIFFFARTRRCAMVAMGTRYARAIDSVESPASVRSDGLSVDPSRDRHEGPDFDAAILCARNLRGPVERLIERRGIEDVEAGKPLFGL